MGQRGLQWTAGTEVMLTERRGSPRRTVAALLIGLIFVALFGVVSALPAIGADPLGLLLLSPAVAAAQLLLLFVGERDGRRHTWERIAVIASCVIAAACLASFVFLVWFVIALDRAD
jgi:hypothetical protein